MSTDTAAPREHTAPGLAAWLGAAPLGQYLLAREQAYFDATVADIFGFNAVQLGLPELDFLRANRIPFKCRVHPAARAAANAGAGDGNVPRPPEIQADYRDLPLESNSVDLLVLPHVLEFSAHPHQILREVHRVLMPEGSVVIAGFNPWSLWGLHRMLGRREAYPWCGRFIHLSRIKDWLALLGLDVDAGRTACYLPPFTQEKWLHRFRFMDAAGDRWWPIAGGTYFLHAVKRVRGMRIITPAWRDRAVAKKRLAAVPERMAERLAPDAPAEGEAPLRRRAG